MDILPDNPVLPGVWYLFMIRLDFTLHFTPKERFSYKICISKIRSWNINFLHLIVSDGWRLLHSSLRLWISASCPSQELISHLQPLRNFKFPLHCGKAARLGYPIERSGQRGPSAKVKASQTLILTLPDSHSNPPKHSDDITNVVNLKRYRVQLDKSESSHCDLPSSARQFLIERSDPFIVESSTLVCNGIAQS